MQIQQSFGSKFPTVFIPFVSLHFTLSQTELSQQMIHNAHLSQRQRECPHSVVRAQTWVRANMVFVLITCDRDIYNGLRDLCVFTGKHAQEEYWCQSIMHNPPVMIDMSCESGVVSRGGSTAIRAWPVWPWWTVSIKNRWQLLKHKTKPELQR